MIRFDAGFKGNVAAENILKLIRRQEGGVSEPLQSYTPGPPGIKVSVGLVRICCCDYNLQLTRLFDLGPRVVPEGSKSCDDGRPTA